MTNLQLDIAHVFSLWQFKAGSMRRVVSKNIQELGVAFWHMPSDTACLLDLQKYCISMYLVEKGVI